jgi:galactosylceramidase
MKKLSLLTIISLYFFTLVHAQTITIKAHDTGRTFEGIGALSAGASSRLLIDYPEPYRSDILDFLFKPKFGASLWQLKVENGGDINSTDGSEPAYAHTQEEFLHPKAAYFNRGYEWWLIEEAKKRNPDIKIEILQWGAPGYIDSFYSKENAEFIAGYIKGLKKYHDITVDYTGIHNEVMYDISWIKLLHKTLDKEGLSYVKIDAGDQWKPEVKWQIANDIANDPELDKAVYAINAHVPEETDFYLPPNAFKINKPIWSGESHAPGGDWYAAAKMARVNNRAYPRAKITKMIYWSLITSYPDYLTAPGSGMMKANTPWSGHYEVQPPLWMYAHINQFAKPGCKYMESGCKYFKREGWSVITLKDTASDNYSIIIETMHAKEGHTVHFKLPDTFSDQPLSVWESSFKKFLFKRQENITSQNHEFSITIKPNSIYSLTTTRGQKKGKPAHAIPPVAPFPKTYTDNFDQDSLYHQPPFFINYHGAFEVVKDKNSDNCYLKQCSLHQGINWFHQPYPSILLGDSAWKDVEASVDFLLPDTGIVRMEMRLHNFSWNSKIPGYCFEINHKGKWKLKLANQKIVLQSGNYKPLKHEWHHLQFSCIGDRLTVWIDHKQVAQIRDSRYKSGVIALATGWNESWFDNFKVEAK